MRYIHPAVWAGLLLNAALMAMLSMTLSYLRSLPPSEISTVDPSLFAALETLQPLMFPLLSIQAAAVGLIASRIKAGIVLAIIAGFFELPASLVYIIGCLLSHYRFKYSVFPSVAAHDQAQAVFPSAYVSILPYLALGGFALGALCFVTGSRDWGLMAFSLGLAGSYLHSRAKKFYALSLHHTYFTVTPGLFADPLKILYSTVQAATLHADKSIHFTIEAKPGQTLTLFWSLLKVEKKSRQAALESLGTTLAAHYVPLY
ncbi:MAG: hypothetical protein LBD42_06250 [Desulfovibrio sp.]|jgi:hypothetical protein|nr:hypothetical protein [Desulfovibrio sp.]